MTWPVNYVELHSPDLAKTSAFMRAAFGWAPEPFAAPDYLVAAAAEAPGVDSGITASRDGTPRTVAIITVPSLDEALVEVRRAGGAVVVEPFAIAGVGRGCYLVDPAGVLLGLHEYDPDAV